MNNVLQFIGHEEGRIRPDTNPNGQVRLHTLECDYFLKGHLGDTRMVLTDQFRRDAYPTATTEVGDSTVENIVNKSSFFPTETLVVFSLKPHVCSTHSVNSFQKINIKILT